MKNGFKRKKKSKAFYTMAQKIIYLFEYSNILLQN